VMLDNGAFSVWRKGLKVEWNDYYRWCDKWLDCPTTWAVIPDVIDGDDDDNNRLMAQWPYGFRGSPVWHMHEGLDRLVWLTEMWPRVCIGSSSQYSRVLSDGWQTRMDEAWNELSRRHMRTPNIHLLRGMACVGKRWPLASVDSTDIGRNHNRQQNTPLKMADRWDAIQCPYKWEVRNGTGDLFGEEVA
jgi:hypothetical protein